MGQNGWPFASVDVFPAADPDPLYNSQHVKDLYIKADPNYEGRFTVPVLWDKKTHNIVNNESSEIIRMFNSAFNEFLPEDQQNLDFYPEDLREKIDEVNDWIYPNINSKQFGINISSFLVELTLLVYTTLLDGVYRAGFAKSQEAYSKAVNEVFEALDEVERKLEANEYLLGNRFTEADIRLWVTLVRFSNFIFLKILVENRPLCFCRSASTQSM